MIAIYEKLIENTKIVRLVLYFPSDITKDFGFVSVSLCHVVFPISNVNIYTTYNYSLHVQLCADLWTGQQNAQQVTFSLCFIGIKVINAQKIMSSR